MWISRGSHHPYMASHEKTQPTPLTPKSRPTHSGRPRSPWKRKSSPARSRRPRSLADQPNHIGSLIQKIHEAHRGDFNPKDSWSIQGRLLSEKFMRRTGGDFNPKNSWGHIRETSEGLSSWGSRVFAPGNDGGWTLVALLITGEGRNLVLNEEWNGEAALSKRSFAQCSSLMH